MCNFFLLPSTVKDNQVKHCRIRSQCWCVLQPVKIGGFHQFSRAFGFFLILMNIKMHLKSHHCLLFSHGHSEKGGYSTVYSLCVTCRPSLHTLCLNTSSEYDSPKHTNNIHRASPWCPMWGLVLSAYIWNSTHAITNEYPRCANWSCLP